MFGLIGKKLGMTRLFNEDGTVIPITVVEVLPNHVVQVKNDEKYGYISVQLTTGCVDFSSLIKPKLGHFLKSGMNYGGVGLWELRFTRSNKKILVGDIITIQIFSDIRKVDVVGISKGKGFSGTVKRWNFRTQDASHGNSLSHRAPGSIGQNQTPGRVFKGKKMSGQLGNNRRTIQNLDIVRVDVNKNLLLIKGSIPGSIGGNVIVKKSIKVKFIGDINI